MAPVEADHAEFWSLYDDALPKIYGYLARRCERSLAEDLTQEVFGTLARTMATNPEAQVSLPWLYTVARSRLFDHLRAQRRAERNQVLAWARRDDDPASVERSYEHRNLGVATERALEQLPTAQRAALVLHHLDDLSVAEVADRIGRSVRATESLLVRARDAFRAAFEGAGDD